MPIFLTFGAPAIIQSDRGREFCNKVITALVEMWDGMKIINGSPRYPKSQGAIERANRDIQDMIQSWMSDHNVICP